MIKKTAVTVYLCLAALLLSCDMHLDTLKVVSCIPGSNVTGVSSESYVEIRFSSDVNRTDVEENFTLKNINGSIDGGFTWLSGDSFKYTPSVPMSRNGRYVIELPRRVRDTDGNSMGSDFISEFYVGSDFVPPSITSSTPGFSNSVAAGVPVDQNIIISFSKSMNREIVEREFSISPDVPGYFTWSESIPGVPYSRLTYNLTSVMEYGRLHTVKISSSAEDSEGNSLGSDYILKFITGDDFTPPVVEAMYDWDSPGEQWITTAPVYDISRDVTIGVTFSSAMDRQSVEKAFSITPSVQGIFRWSSDLTVNFIPRTPLSPETKYQVSVSTTAKNRNSLKLGARYSVEIVTDNPDSLYVRCGTVRGSNHDGDFIPLTGGWPILIDMGTGIPVNSSYFITIEFITGNPSIAMNRYSIFDNVIIETFKGTSGTGDLPPSAYISFIEWTGDNEVKIKLTGMTNRSADPPQVPSLYRLKIAGGENGIKDERGNYMKEDFVIEFREEMP